MRRTTHHDRSALASGSAAACRHAAALGALLLLACSAAAEESAADPEIVACVRKAAAAALEDVVDVSAGELQVEVAGTAVGYTARVRYRLRKHPNPRVPIVRGAMKTVYLLFRGAGCPGVRDLELVALPPGGGPKDTAEPLGVIGISRAVADRIEWQNMTPRRFEELLSKHGCAVLPKLIVVIRDDRPTPLPAGDEPLEAHLNRFYGQLVQLGIADALVRDVQPGASPLEVRILVSDDWRRLDAGKRRESGEELWALWSQLRSPSDPDKASIVLVSEQEQEVGGSRGWSTSTIWLEDD